LISQYNRTNWPEGDNTKKMLVVHIIVHNENYIYRLVEIVIRSIYIINLAIKSINRHAGLDPASSRFHYGFRLSPE